MNRKRILIMGAAGRDFHDFNTCFRNNPYYKVVAFTQHTGQNIGELGEKISRIYPKELAGKLYPKGIPIFLEKDLKNLIKKLRVDEVVFSYSDNSHEYVMHLASQVLSAGANFKLIGPKAIQLKSKKPVIAVCAVRTGCGKSQTTRKIAKILKSKGKKVVAVREPMPYGNLKKQIVQRFASFKDLANQKTTIEEREEFEPYIENGFVVFAGVDYEKILKQAEKEADIILWDGGNNELSFYKTDLLIVVVDPFRVGHETLYHPGETNLLMADIVLINKVNTAPAENVQKLKENIKKANPKAKIIEANSIIFLDKSIDLRGKKVLVVEDGPTVTHGGMNFGAGFIIAEKLGAEIIDPRPFAVGSIKKIFEKYSFLEKILPAMGYSKTQLKELEQTINKSKCDFVVSGTPIDLSRLLKVNKPVLRARYELEEIISGELEKAVEKFLKKGK